MASRDKIGLAAISKANELQKLISIFNDTDIVIINNSINDINNIIDELKVDINELKNAEDLTVSMKNVKRYLRLKESLA